MKAKGLVVDRNKVKGMPRFTRCVHNRLDCHADNVRTSLPSLSSYFARLVLFSEGSLLYVLGFTDKIIYSYW